MQKQRCALNSIRIRILIAALMLVGCGGGGGSPNSPLIPAIASSGGATVESPPENAQLEFIAGSNEQLAGIVEGQGGDARIGMSYGAKTAVSSAGTMFLGMGSVVVSVSPAGNVKSLVGVKDELSSVDGAGQLARINGISNMLFDQDENLLLLETSTGKIRHIDTATGSIRTLRESNREGCGNEHAVPPKSAILEGPIATVCWSPTSLAMDAEGRWLVVNAHRLIQRFDPNTGLVTVVAGVWPMLKQVNDQLVNVNEVFGQGDAAKFENVESAVFDRASGDYFIVDSGSSTGTGRVKRVSANGIVSMVVESADLFASNVVAGRTGKLYTNIGRVLEIDPVRKTFSERAEFKGLLIWSLGFDSSNVAYVTVPWSTLWRTRQALD